MKRTIIASIFLFAVIFFLLPWVNISCAGVPVISATGFDMVTGDYDIPEETMEEAEAESEPLAMGALAAAVFGLIFSLFKGKFASFLRFLAGIAGIGLLIALKLKIDNDVSGQGQGVVHVNYMIGYWLTLFAFAVTVIIGFITRDIAKKLVKTPEPSAPGSGPPIEKPPPS